MSESEASNDSSANCSQGNASVDSLPAQSRMVKTTAPNLDTEEADDLQSSQGSSQSSAPNKINLL